MEPEKRDWEQSKIENQHLIIHNKMQITMAEEILKMCDKKIAGFPEEDKKQKV